MGLLEVGLLLVLVAMLLAVLAKAATVSPFLVFGLLAGLGVLVGLGFGAAALLKRRARLARAAEAEVRALQAQQRTDERKQRERQAEVGKALTLLTTRLEEGALVDELRELDQTIQVWEANMSDAPSARIKHAVAMIRESAFSIANDFTLLGSYDVLADLGETARSLAKEIKMEMRRFDQVRISDMSLTLRSLDAQMQLGAREPSR